MRLSGASRPAWYYTRAVPAPNGMVFVLGYDGKMYYLDPAGAGAITQLPQQTLGATYAMPAVTFRPGMILSVRNNRKVMIVDLNGPQPVVTPTADLDQERVGRPRRSSPTGRSW
jgi:hypothetical protein